MKEGGREKGRKRYMIVYPFSVSIYLQQMTDLQESARAKKSFSTDGSMAYVRDCKNMYINPTHLPNMYMMYMYIHLET